MEACRVIMGCDSQPFTLCVCVLVSDDFFAHCREYDYAQLKNCLLF